MTDHDLVGTWWKTTGWIGGAGLIEVTKILNSTVTLKPFMAICITESGKEVEYPLNRRGTRLRSCRKVKHP